MAASLREGKVRRTCTPLIKPYSFLRNTAPSEESGHA
jgi:hypothetical protein